MEEIEINIKKINFKKTKSSDNNFKKNYIMTHEGKKPLITINNVNIPFGVEKYNDRLVLNIEINKKSSNEHYNAYSTLITFEKQFAEKTNFNDKTVLEDISDKGYYQNIKKNGSSHIIRTYIFNKPDIYSFAGPMILDDVKKVKANIILELGCMWSNDNNYGILWYVKEIEVLHGL